MAHFVATVHILIDADDPHEAADTISALLTENGIYDDSAHVVDWSYLRNDDSTYRFPKPIKIANGYDRDEADLHAIATQ